MNKAMISLIGESYHIVESDCFALCTLARFLIDDAHPIDNPLLKEWLFDQKIVLKSGNTTSLEKYEGKIFITSDLNEDDDEFEISKTDFILLIDRWMVLFKEKPSEIIITKEGEKITLEGKN